MSESQPGSGFPVPRLFDRWGACSASATLTGAPGPPGLKNTNQLLPRHRGLQMPRHTISDVKPRGRRDGARRPFGLENPRGFPGFAVKTELACLPRGSHTRILRLPRTPGRPRGVRRLTPRSVRSSLAGWLPRDCGILPLRVSCACHLRLRSPTPSSSARSRCCPRILPGATDPATSTRGGGRRGSLAVSRE